MAHAVCQRPITGTGPGVEPDVHMNFCDRNCGTTTTPPQALQSILDVSFQHNTPHALPGAGHYANFFISIIFRSYSTSSVHLFRSLAIFLVPAFWQSLRVLAFFRYASLQYVSTIFICAILYILQWRTGSAVHVPLARPNTRLFMLSALNILCAPYISHNKQLLYSYTIVTESL